MPHIWMPLVIVDTTAGGTSNSTVNTASPCSLHWLHSLLDCQLFKRRPCKVLMLDPVLLSLNPPLPVTRNLPPRPTSSPNQVPLLRHQPWKEVARMTLPPQQCLFVFPPALRSQAVPHRSVMWLWIACRAARNARCRYSPQFSCARLRTLIAQTASWACKTLIAYNAP